MDRKTCTSGSVTKIFAILLIICLVECATGSCLSYGHSCWGAHGKRSGKPASAPDWYLDRILRRMAASAELDRAKSLALKKQDDNAIYELSVPDDSGAPNKDSDNDEGLMNLSARRNMEAKPMLDDDLISKMKIWQIMKETSERD